MVSLTAARTALFVPATRPERIAKAAASGADAIILDLEDAVAPSEKDMARANLAAMRADLPLLLRINGIGTPWHDQDLAAARALPFAAVMLPKAEDPEKIAALQLGLPIVALIETATGLARAREIATLPGLVRLAFGSVDYAADLGLAHSREPLLAARTELVLAARLAGLAAPFDGVTVALDDPEEAGRDAAHARAMGMTGKLCIHPSQIAPVAQAFAPTAAEIDWAHRVLASGDGATRLDGAMVDEPVRLRARAILAGAVA